MTNITVLKDESLGGVEREYREVKRKADVGERIKIVDEDSGYEVGRVFTVTDGDYDWGGGGRLRDGTGVEVDGGVPLFHKRYLALEPTDIIRIDGARFRMVDRKASVGERVIALNDCDRFYRAGDVGTLTNFGMADFSGNDYVYGDGIWAIDEYRVLEPVESAETAPLSVKPAPDQAAELIAKLTTRVASLEKRVAALETPKSRPATDEEVADVISKLSRAKSPQEIRDEIVKRAKEDVSDLRKFKGTKIPNDFVHFWPHVDKSTEYLPMHAVEYVVNRDKRTVVAIIRCTDDGHITRGIAKCAPGDVFNAHIGRAIALRRALGLEVPAEYFEAPNPTEVRVGDYVYNSAKTKRMLIVTPDKLRFGQFLTKGYSVIDDSRDDESDSAEPRKEVA